MSKSVHDMFASIARRYDCANDVLSLGMHRLWRGVALRAAGVQAGQTVVDLCTGTGDVAFAAADMVGPSGKVIGLDFVQEMVDIAEQKRLDRNYPQIEFSRADALDLPLPDGCADLACVSFGIRNVDDPVQCLREMKRVVKENGTVMVLEFGQPKLPLFSQLYTFYSKYFMPFIGGALTGNRAAYEYLPETSSEFPAGAAFLQFMEEAGLEQMSFKPLFAGVAYIYTASAGQMTGISEAEKAETDQAEIGNL